MTAHCQRRSTAPFLFFFLVLPAGISTGFASLALPFILTQIGFSVAAAGYVVAAGACAHCFRFLWGPVADLTLTPRTWYLIGLLAAAGTLLLVSLISVRSNGIALFATVVFISQVAASLVFLPLGGLMAHTVTREQQGRASGWYQAGNLSGNAIGGSGGIWLAAHYSKEVAGWTVSLGLLPCVIAILFVSDFRPAVDEALWERIRIMGGDVLGIFRTATPVLVALLVCSPIAVGAMSHQWGSVWRDWHTTPNKVALITGIFSGLAAAVGCIIGGWLADRIGVWRAYFGSGIGLALVAVAMAIARRTPESFFIGVSAYAFMVGLGYAAFSALILFAIGRGAASTKYALLSSLGNIPVAYMIALTGWVHDQYGVSPMLYVDAFSGISFIAVAILVLQRLQRPGSCGESAPSRP